jgi:hypothetical protein
MVTPLKVTVTTVEAAICALAVVITIAVDDGTAEIPVDIPLINTVGVDTRLKKPEG